jgi:hypothetical protein
VAAGLAAAGRSSHDEKLALDFWFKLARTRVGGELLGPHLRAADPAGLQMGAGMPRQAGAVPLRFNDRGRDA